MSNLPPPVPGQQPGYVQRPQPAPRRKRSGCLVPVVAVGGLIGIAAVVAVALTLAGVKPPKAEPAASTSTTTPPSTDAPPAWEAHCPGDTVREVTYLVTGSAKSAQITASVPSGITQHDVAVPMAQKDGTPVSFCAAEDFVPTISAQNDGDGTIECSIVVDGTTASHVESSGEFAIADCSIG